MSTTSNTITTRVFDYSTSLRPDKYNEARSTIAGYFNSDGVWTIAPANVPRIDYDPSTVRGNYCISSSDLTKVYPIFGDDGSAWFPAADITVTRDGTLAPDGSLAVKIERVIGEVYPPEIFQFINAPANSTQLISVYAKAGSHSMVFLNLENNASPNENATASFDISGTDPIIFPQQQATQGGGRILDAYGVYQGNGWYRIILCGNVDTADGFYIVFGMTPKTAYNLDQFGEPFWNDETNTPAYAYFANPQTEINTVTVGDYIATTTAPAFSSAQPRGLLVEPTHTNLYVNSSDLNDATAWTYNSTQLTNDGSIAPDGSLAFVLTATTNTDYNNVLYNLDPITITPNTNYGLSVYAHADTANYLYINIQEWFTTNSFAGAVFDLTGHANGTPTQTYVGSTSGQIISAVSEYVGDGWFRCSLVANINDVGAAATIGMSDSPTPALIDVFGNIQPIGFQKSIRLAMPQFEQGNTVTSYIKTKGGALTRTADDITFALNDIETSSLVFTFDDNTTQTLSAKGATIYTIPTNLQRPWIRYIDVQVLHKTTSINEDYNSILPFIEKQFPEFYQDQGPIFIEFVKAYYDWLSQTDGLLDKIRNFEKYHDVDTTLDEFLTHFTNAYLYGVPSSILGDKRFLIKHVLDVYRSKGTIQGYKLLFRLLYDEDIDVYLPQKDMLLLSDGTWYAPKYLEVSDNPLNATFIGKRIKGSASGAEAIVQDYIVQFVGKAVCVLYLSNITGEFQQGEKILAIQDFDTIAVLDAPTVLGSLTSLAIISGGQNFNVGDILVPTNGTGREVQYRVSGTANGTGTLLYNIVDGGSMYSTSANTYLTRTTNSGHGSSFDIGGVSSVQTFQFNKDIIIALANTLINDPNYHFMGMDNANAATQIGNAFTYDSRLFGTIEHLTNILTGNSYTSPPNVTVKDVIYTGNLVGNVFWSNSSANVVGVGTDFTYYFHAGDYIEFQIAHESNPFVEHRIISSVTNSTFLTLDDYPATYGDGGFEAISISAGGTGYANGAYITFTDSLGTGANAQIFTNTSGGITSIILNNRGSHYLSPTLTAPVGTGATLAGLIDYGNFSLGVPLISSQFSQSFLANTILNSEDGNNAIITATPQFGVGIIANVEVRSSGFGYHDDELLEFGALGALKDITINLGGTLYQNNEPLIFSGGAPVNEAVGSVLTDANGTITTLNIVYAGSGYQTVPTIRVRTIGGSGANISANVGGLDHTFLVSGYGVKTGVGRQQGFWTSTRGFLDSDKYIQDSFYYQQMSYEIQAPKTLELYADILKKVIHPAGYEMFGKYVYSDLAGEAASELSMSLLLSSAVAQLLNWFVDFTAGVLPSWLTFSRTTTATYFNANGVMVTANSNVPRFDYQWDGAHWNHDGLLIEEQRTNLVPRSNQLTANTGGNPAWGWDSPLTITPSAVTSVDGVTPMWTLTNTQTTANNQSFVFYNSDNAGFNTAVNDGDTISVSFYIKKGSLRYVVLQTEFWAPGSSTFNNVFAVLDLDTGLIANTVVSTLSGLQKPGNLINQSLTPVGANGIYRYTTAMRSDAGVTDGTGTVRYFIEILGAQDATGNNGTYLYNWAGGETILVSHFQFEKGNNATSYIDTPDALVTRAIDNLTLTVGSSAETAYTGNAASVILDLTDAKSNWANFMFPSSGVGVAPLYFNPNANGTANVGTYTIPDELDTTNVLDISLENRLGLAFDSSGRAVSSDGNNASFNSTALGSHPGPVTVVHGGGHNFTGHLGELDLYNYRLDNPTLEKKTAIAPVIPSVEQDFTALHSVPDWLSFSRTTTATYFNANGVLSTASANTARFGYEYVGGVWVAGGFLIETEQRTNLALQSVDMQNAAWTVSGTTNGTDTTVLPDGSLAGKLTCVAGSAAHNIFSTSPYATGTSDANYAQSWIVKAGTHPYIYVTTGSNGTVISAVFNLSNATATVASQTAVSGAGSTVFATKQVNLGNGYFRVTLVGSLTSPTLYQVVGFAPAATGNTFDVVGNIVFTAAGTETIYFGMPQLEAGNYATSYIPTTSAAVTRAADIVRTTGLADTALTNVATSIIMEAKLKGYLSNGRLLNRSDSSVAALYLPGSQLGTYDGTHTSPNVTFGGGANPANGDIIRAGIAWNVGGSSIAGNGSNTTRVAWHAALNNNSYIFRDNAGGENVNGFLRSMAIYNKRLRDATLISTTTVGATY